MKKVLFFVAALLTLTFAACSNTKEDPNPHCWKMTTNEEGSQELYFWGSESDVNLFTEFVKKELAEKIADPQINSVKVEQNQSECLDHEHSATYECHKITIENTQTHEVFYEQYFWATLEESSFICDQLTASKLHEFDEQGGMLLDVFDNVVKDANKSDCESHNGK